MHTNTATNSNDGFNRLILSLVLAPAVLLGLTFAAAMLMTQWLVPGSSGSEALVMSAVLIGLASGFVVAKLNSNYPLHSAVYAATFASLLYFSLRLFWLDAPLTLAASGFVLIVPAALLGAVSAQKMGKKS